MAKIDTKTDTKSETARSSRTPRRATSTAASRTSRRAGSAKTETRYHHGALREALLQAAERVLERDGLAGLTLRAVAREAGVSHAAPTHHFGDLTGLLSELAAVGFCQFNAATAASCEVAATPLEAALARPKAYVAYAQAHPGMYSIMFRTERLDYSRPSLHEAAEASFAGLANAVGMMRQEQIRGDALTLSQGAAIARAWSMVHGFTTLLLDGRLEDILGRLPEGTTAERLLEAMLTAPVTTKLPA
ncbi:TetR/AcrR family transcriptional regulator [Bradyrhizobium sp. CCBAU 53415]|uniref:TetR/AcrR family transcriptional regulator n=1 Tax=Bradyrhizobium sp. CCBAU 53415 TaxID=1325119 RepID=UPI002306B830|nr:WHG domain-containing protein [Bradyrhizobium sp. CCBAU 53415]MDA9463930.1 transcriptional regulator [Bradyrhizobium sp. CCBAU 53415]